jgi:hypothetical protein
MTTVLDRIEERDPIAAPALELPALVALKRLLQSNEAGEIQLVGPAGEVIAVPPSLLRVLRRAVAILARDMVVRIEDIPKSLTLSWASELLHVPQHYLIGLLDAGEIASTGVGLDRRVAFADLMAYKRTRDARRVKSLDSMTWNFRQRMKPRARKNSSS